MTDYLCRNCGLIRVPEEEVSLSAIVAPGLRFHTLCGYVVKEMAEREAELEPAPDKLRAQHVLLVLLDALDIGYNAESLREPRITEARKGLQVALRVAYRAGQERMRERAAHRAEATDVIHGRKVAHGIAAVIRELPLEEAE